MNVSELLTEPIVVPDVFVTNLSAIEDLGDGNYRFTFTVFQMGCHVIVARLVAPMSLVINGSRASLNAVGAKCPCHALAYH